MSETRPNIWGKETTGKYTADLIGWDDESGHRHKGTPKRNNSEVDGLIIRIGNRDDADYSKVLTVYKSAGTRNPTPEQWIERILNAIRRHKYLFDLSYDSE